MIAFLLIIFLLAGCGGGDRPPGAPPVENAVLRWDPPATFTDNTPLDPKRDLAEYEIYACDNEAFLDFLLPSAMVVVVDNEDRVVSSFNLQLLRPHGIVPPKWITIKSVARNSMSSRFADPVLWTE